MKDLSWCNVAIIEAFPHCYEICPIMVEKIGSKYTLCNVMSPSLSDKNMWLWVSNSMIHENYDSALEYMQGMM